MARSKRSVSSASGKNCSAACLTKDHKTFGECMRAKSLQIRPNLQNANAQKAWDNRLDRYRSAVDQGLSPAGTQTAQIDAAFKAVDGAAS